MRPTRWQSLTCLPAALLLSGCVDLFRPYAEDNPENCTVNPGLCAADQQCSPLTHLCEPRSQVGLALLSVTPPLGPSIGGIDLVLTGRGFLQETAVRVADQPAGNVRVESPERLHADLPARPGTCGAVEVAVQNPGTAPVALEGQFRYITPALSFAEQFKLPVFDPGSLAVADLDLDGYPDLVAVSRRTSGALLLYGRKDGAYESTGSGPSADVDDLAVGDLDGDGRPDLATLSVASSTLIPYTQTAARSFGAAPGALVQGGPRRLALGDLDQDGRQEVVVTTDSPYVHVVRKTGGTYGVVQMPSCLASAALVTELTGDGNADVVLACADAGLVSVFPGKGDGTFSPRVDTPVPGRPVSLAASDLDGDRVPDLAVGLELSRSAVHGLVLQGLGGGRLAAAGELISPGLEGAMAEHQVAVTDLDCDGRQEVLLAVAGSQNQVVVFTREIQGRYLPRPAPGLMTGQAPRRMAVADLDRDGRLDIVVTVPDIDSVVPLRNTSK